MNLAEATVLLRTVKAVCPSQQIDTYTFEAWAMALDDIRAVDAKAAIEVMAKRELEPGKSRYIEPGHIRAEVRRLRERRINDAPAYEPPDGLDTRGYLAWLAAARRSIADGEIPVGHDPRSIPPRRVDLPELPSVDEAS